MAIDLRNHKLDRAFEHIEVSGAGEIERADLLGLGARILVGFGESPTSAAGTRLVDSFDGIWAALSEALGRDQQTRMSREDFHAAMATAFIEGEGFDTVFRPAIQVVAELCDADGDGLIGPAEFRTMLSAFGTAYDDVDEAFDRLDRSGRGVLAVTELVEAARQYYVGDDPHASGNWLFGPL